VISALLQKCNTRLTTHLWKEDETRIANLGFHVNVDPGNYLKTDFEEKVRSHISQATGKSIKKIPRFQCSFASPFVMTEDGNRIATKSYDMQCRQKDAKELINLLQKAYSTHPTFIFHRLCHNNLTAYTNAIRRQNLFLSQSRVVPIQGVNEEAMFSLSNELLMIDGISLILRHKDTTTKGRWSIMTDEKNFKAVVGMIKKDLKPWVLHYSEDYPSPDGFPPPDLAFRNKMYDEGSENSGASFASYMSACSSIYTVDNDDFDLPPAPTNAAPQAWGNVSRIPELLNSTVSTPANSGISQDEFDKVTRENAKLLRKLDELNKKFDDFVTARAPSNNPPPSAVPPFDLNQMAATITATVLRSIAQAQQSTPPTNIAITDTQHEGEDARNMSLDASEEDSYTTRRIEGS
jgi:hypothetical protein